MARVAAEPAAMIATAPATGSSAASPGKGVEASKLIAAIAMQAMPTYMSSAASRLSRRLLRGSASATSAPAASSQARVKME